MSHQAEKRARAEAMLGELAELGLMVAKELAVRVRESEDVSETAALTEAFHKVSRVVRLTLALDFKLERDAARDARAEAVEAKAAEVEADRRERLEAVTAPRPVHPIDARKSRVENLLNRLIWNECEGDSEEYEILCDDLATRLDEAARSPDFLDLPVETIARRMIADMGLRGELKLSLCEPPPTLEAHRSPEPADTG